jgi:MFS family permease
MQTPSAREPAWYYEVTRYQWMVLAIASAGWVFDVFEGQIFGSCMSQVVPALLGGTGLEQHRELFVNLWIAAFLAGGAAGGLIFGMMADRWGRRRTMAVTILMYSLFTGLTFFVETWWQLMILRFLVGLGVGGEWAVAAAAVAEVFPTRARPVASGIFHASSILGTYLAVLAGVLVVPVAANGWRWAFLLGVAPALLVFWVRVSMREPETWQSARTLARTDAARRLGRFRDLFSTPTLARNTLLATALATVGLATFWGAHFRGKDLLRQAAQRAADDSVQASNATAQSLQYYEMLGMFLATSGGGIGLLSFAPISQRLGRRRAFALFHVGGFLLVILACVLADSVAGLIILLPVFGFFTLGMHAGYAVYFPELYPTRLRGTGSGFCFNVGRIVASPVMFGFGALQGPPLNLGLPMAMLILGSLFPLGLFLLILAPETRGQPLPE